ncbi:uncharacterized protein LOC143486080 [Brachyhypopomus gauderio]|uniref:uncharacterized protein LOC143486080 n=1 Tax=Brachyhypopomus gauderio TaxID=698409 RepID=UPI0040437ACC
MATPRVRVVNPNAPARRQQAILMATKEARLYREKKTTFPMPPRQLLDQSTALVHAEKLAHADGIHAPSHQLCLGKLVLPFGQYEHAPFHWLVENDVGYMKYLVDKHRAEVTNPLRKAEIQNHWIKDYLVEYAESFPQVSMLLEANIDQCIYGQKGFEHQTFQEMWELYWQYSVQKARPDDFSSEQRDMIKKGYSSVCKWLHTPLNHITSVQMKRFRRFIIEKKEKEASSPMCDPSLLKDSSLSVVVKSPEEASTSTANLGEGSKESPCVSQEVLPTVCSEESASTVRAKESLPTGKSKKTKDKPHDSSNKAAPSVVKSTASLPTLKSKDSRTTESSSLVKTHISEGELSQSISPVELEGWVRLWENPNGIPEADISWLKDDQERGLFTPVQVYHDNTGKLKRRRVVKCDRMWFHPPETPGYVAGNPPTPQLFFRSRVFLWRPVGVWRYSLKCPRGDECVGKGKDVYLYKSGYYHRVRHICDVSGWYSMLTEVLCCGPCTKAARSSQGVKMGRWLAWDSKILSQLSEAHQAMFPAVLTNKRGVDRNVIRLLRDRTEGNTMVKVWRQIQENHSEEYLRRKDLYTTLLMTLVKPGGIVSALGHAFKAPPSQRELPSARLLRHAFLLAEAENVQDYRNQILSTFGMVLKMDSTKKVVKKLSGEGKGTAEWFTSIGNEYSQIVSFVLTCEESTKSLEPMCRGVVDRFQQANQPVPKIIYVDRGCCRAQGPTSVEILFQPWVDAGMVVRLDIFHWIHRFDAAVRTESHSKYATFKSALAGAVLAYNRTDLERLIEAVRAKDLATLKSLSNEDIVRLYISRQQLKHHVRRVTLGAQETFRLIHLAIEELKGPAGLDENGVSLFKTPEAIDEMWAAQQRHLECIQDPPDMYMYRVARTTTIHGVDVPYYKCLRGSNSLEGFHKALPNMIPGPHCAARPYQVYLISGIARWNSDRSSDAVFGGKGRHHRTYSAPLIHRLNTRCQQLFDETVEENFRAPADIPSNELLGLEYLFSQSTGESFSLQDIIDDGPSSEEEVVQPGQPDPDEHDEAYQSDTEARGDVLDAVLPHITLTSDETATIHPPAFEDACSPNPLPGFQKLEKFCSALVEIGLQEDKLLLTTEQRNRVLEAWNAVEEHDKQPQQFNQLYRTHWGNTLYCRTKRDDLVDAALIQRLKMAKRYAPAQQDISAQNNRLMYTLVKLLWLRSPRGSSTSPEKMAILKGYERIQHRVLVEDPVLCKAGIPLPKINIKTVRDFIHRQERLLNLHATKQPCTITKTRSISTADLPPAPLQPAVLPPPDYPLMQYVPTPSTAGTKVLKGRTDIMTPHSRPQPPVSPALLPPQDRKKRSATTRPVIAGPSKLPIMPVSQTSGIAGPSALLGLPSWAKSTQYKRKLKDYPSGLGATQSRVQTLPVCTVCDQLTQGHKKYKKKTFCPVKMMSPSKGLTNSVYDSYEHFMSVVDGLNE